MRVTRVLLDGSAFYGALQDDSTVRVLGRSIGDPADGRVVDLAAVTVLPPVAPSKIVCVGLNYRDHATETGSAIPAAPIVFSKYPSSIIGNGDRIVLPDSAGDAVDFEAELGVVIGRVTKDADERTALEAVFGYTCVNDVSARDAQVADGQWVRAKSFDTFCPVGPWITTAGEIPDPQTLAISCDVNGQRLQDSSTAELIFGVAELIAYVSRSTTLNPGDLILTGTPAGIGNARTPKIFLHDGDSVTVSIESIGSITNPVAQLVAAGGAR